MRKVSFRIAFAALAMCVLAGGAQAQGKGKGHGNGKARGHGNDVDRRERPVLVGTRPARRDVPPGLAKKGGVPPGLAKKGGIPPGQAKKLVRIDDGMIVLRDVFDRRGYTVVRTDGWGDERYVYYRLSDGTVRRAVIRPRSERLSFVNVPTLVLREVLARLY